MRFLAFFLAVTLIFIISLTIKAEVMFYYRRLNKEDHVEISLRALRGLWQFKLEIPDVELEWDSGPEINFAQQAQSQLSDEREQQTKIKIRFWRWGIFYRFWPQVFNIIRRLKKVKYDFYQGIYLTDFKLDMAIGLKNPAHTAMAAGALWSYAGNAIAKMYRQVKVEAKEPHINIIPEFQNPGFSCDFSCIFKLKIGHIIFAGLKLLYIFKWHTRG